MYRPEGLENPYDVKHNPRRFDSKERDIFWEGVDAAVKALRDAEHSYGASILRPDNIKPLHGKFCFIPDEERK